jgi:DNA-directed RNA polymerase specialized sigma24 family protein
MRRVANVNTCAWTPEKDAEFTAMYLHGAKYAELAERFGTSLSGCEKRRLKLGLPSPTQLRESNGG